MLPSQGLFKSIPCPYYVVGLCEKPHCFFRHTKSDFQEARKLLLSAVEDEVDVDTQYDSSIHSTPSKQPDSSRNTPTESDEKKKIEKQSRHKKSGVQEARKLLLPVVQDEPGTKNSSTVHSTSSRQKDNDSSHNTPTESSNNRNKEKQSRGKKTDTLRKLFRPTVKPATKHDSTIHSTSSRQNDSSHNTPTECSNVSKNETNEKNTEEPMSQDSSSMYENGNSSHSNSFDDFYAPAVLDEDYEDDPDDIERECLKMFEEYQPEEKSKEPNNMTHFVEKFNDPMEETASSLLGKRRLAHAGSDVRPPACTAPKIRKTTLNLHEQLARRLESQKAEVPDIPQPSSPPSTDDYSDDSDGCTPRSPTFRLSKAARKRISHVANAKSSSRHSNVHAPATQDPGGLKGGPTNQNKNNKSNQGKMKKSPSPPPTTGKRRGRKGRKGSSSPKEKEPTPPPNNDNAKTIADPMPSTKSVPLPAPSPVSSPNSTPQSVAEHFMKQRNGLTAKIPISTDAKATSLSKNKDANKYAATTPSRTSATHSKSNKAESAKVTKAPSPAANKTSTATPSNKAVSTKVNKVHPIHVTNNNKTSSVNGKGKSTPANKTSSTNGKGKSTPANTIAQTHVKGTTRKAHTPSARPVDVKETPSPQIVSDSPVKSAKISYTVRQYCLDEIYKLCRQLCEHLKAAFERAIREEAEVAIRASSTILYKSKIGAKITSLKRETQQPKAEEPVQHSPVNPIRTEAVQARNSSSSSISPASNRSTPLSSRKSSLSNTAEIPTPIASASSSSTSILSFSSANIFTSTPTTAVRLGHVSDRPKGSLLVLHPELPRGNALYKKLCPHVLTENLLVDNGFPRPAKENIPGRVVAKPRYDARPMIYEERRKTCDRCNKTFHHETDGSQPNESGCEYHPGRFQRKQTNKREWSKFYSCCGAAAADACTCAFHPVHVPRSLPVNDQRGFVSAIKEAGSEDEIGNNPWDIIALDCEMVYTTGGNELARATFVGQDGSVLYDSVVKPARKILDYNTKWSGLTEDDVNNTTTTLQDVQAIMLSHIRPNTIMIGHSLESDLIALKFMHDCVIDTSVMFPHRQGPPLKRGLKTLAIDFLSRIIQESVNGHDSSEDALSALDLVLYKIREEAKVSNQ